jgi:hypothetical protein
LVLSAQWRFAPHDAFNMDVSRGLTNN